MFNRFSITFCLFTFVVTILVGTASASPKIPSTIEMLAGLPKPPFIIEKNDTGLQLDLIREAFSSVNQDVSFIHAPLGRNLTGFKRLNSGGIAIVPATFEHPNIFISKPYVKYQNVAISLTDLNFDISTYSGLSGKSVIAFQNAKKFLGEDYNENISLSTNYREFADQSKQIEMLFSRRTEVIILDINIFKYFLKNNTGRQYNQEYNVHYIFDAQEYAAGFRIEQHRDLFNQGVAHIKEQGIYQLVLDKYLR